MAKAPEREGPRMNRQVAIPDVAVQALHKLDPVSGERRNVAAFLKCCYGGRLRHYDLDAALRSLAKLTPEEQAALIGCTRLRFPSPR